MLVCLLLCGQCVHLSKYSAPDEIVGCDCLQPGSLSDPQELPRGEMGGNWMQSSRCISCSGVSSSKAGRFGATSNMDSI
jgi:hypothetical protein